MYFLTLLLKLKNNEHMKTKIMYIFFLIVSIKMYSIYKYIFWEKIYLKMTESTSQIQNVLKDNQTSGNHQSYLEFRGFSNFTTSRILVKEKYSTLLKPAFQGKNHL